MTHKEEEEGGLHLLHGNSMCEGGVMFWQEVLQWRNRGMIPCNKEAREAGKGGREGKKKS